MTRPSDFTRQREIQEYADRRQITFARAVVELVNRALSDGALVELEQGGL
jgi:hypothetical protein